MLIKLLRKTNNIKFILLAPFLIQLIGIITIVGHLSLKNGEKTVNDLSNKLLSEITSRVEEKLRNYTSSAVLINQLNAKAIETKESYLS